MKKICIFFLLSIIISVTAIGFSGAGWQADARQSKDTEYLRIHIRADSNESSAQAVKYAVRDDVVAYLTPTVADCNTKDEAVKNVRNQLNNVARVATATLRKNGFSYGASARLQKETFPTRVYEGYTLPAGEYTALIIELGSGKGDNWWCVVYPPLCFAAPRGKNVVYKSKILEIIQRWREKR
ncbi:MAG: stage II sporulation protein R [Clostridiales bacterium]|nr:stage II sporulation protein R [Clostridiales bacterium]